MTSIVFVSLKVMVWLNYWIEGLMISITVDVVKVSFYMVMLGRTTIFSSITTVKFDWVMFKGEITSLVLISVITTV